MFISDGASVLDTANISCDRFVLLHWALMIKQSDFIEDNAPVFCLKKKLQFIRFHVDHL